MWTTSSSQPSKKRTPNLFGNSSAPSEEKTLELHRFTKEKSSDIPTPYGPNFPPICNIQVKSNGVQKLLSNIKANKATGPDNIPCRILKEAAPELAPILTDIFQHSLRDGVLPDTWKKAQVSPVFKKGNTNNAENYHPILLTCVSCKLLEHIICHHIHENLDKHSILSSLQHGFRFRHSCGSQLLIAAHDLGKSYNEKKQVDIAILDFSKAFDKVPHQRLLRKLRHYRITGQTCGWIQAFLSNRTQCVVVDGASSQWCPVESGVPQGTVLGPLLFLLFINVLPNFVSSQVRLFADDCLLYRTISSIEDQLKLQADLKSLEDWASTWGMSFNPSKCTIMAISRSSSPFIFFYSLCGVILQQVDEAKYLGILLSSDLMWSKHIQHLVSKTNSTMGLLWRNLTTSSAKLREQAFISLVCSRLEYCCAIWDPHLAKDRDNLEAVQRRAARFVTQDYSRDTSVTQLLKDPHLLQLKDRRRDIRLSLMYRIVTGKVVVPVDDILLPADSRTRRKYEHKYRHFNSTCEQYRHSFFVQTVPEWNLLPEACIKADTTEAFKASLRPTP